MFIEIPCYPVCDIINFEICLIKPSSYMIKKEQKIVSFKNQKTF